MTQPRCAPISDEHWPEAIADMKDGFAVALNVYRTMAHHPDLLRAWAPLRQHIVQKNALGPENAEIVILRAAYRLGAPYEWAHHVSRARKLGMTDERIASVQTGALGLDGVLIAAVDAIFDHRRLSAETEVALVEAVGRKATLDLIATVGFYSTLGYLLMTYDTPLDPQIAAELADAPLEGTLWPAPGP